MSSGQHLTKEMYDLVKSIGETRSKQEEDKIISSELSVLKSKINEKNLSAKRLKENLIRAIYIEMLGHDASFAYIHAVNLTQSKSFVLKRMGYLSCSLFFNENSEFLLLLVAALQKDLASTNVIEVNVALNAVSKLVCGGIVHALVEPIINLLTHASENVRKKAVLCMQRMYSLSPSLISGYSDKMKRALCDKDPSVMGAVLHLYYLECQKNANVYKDLTGSFVVILKQIIEHKLARDYDYHRMPAPWIQCRLLQILALLGENDQRVSEQIYEILGQTLKRADDTGINIGYAVTYQCVKTISSIYPNQILLETAGKSIARFLVSENNNLKYLGINALIPIVQINPKYSIEHQMTVVDCLESTDETLKRETLLLLFKMTNGNNVEIIVEKLLHYLKMTSDPHFKKDLVTKIVQLSERLAPSQEWFIKTMNILFEFGSEFISEDILTNFLKLIEESYRMNPSEVGEYLITTYTDLISKEELPDVLIKVIAWVFGEFGSEIFSDPSQLESLATLLLPKFDSHFEDDITKSWLLNSLSKLSSLANFPQELQKTLDNTIQAYARSKHSDLSQRAVEYRTLRNYRWALRQSSLLEIDKDLAFLNSYVQKAKNAGAKAYDSKKNLASWLSSLGGGEKEVKDIGMGLSFQPYAEKKKEKEDEGSKIISKGPKKWTDQGYKEESPAPKVTPSSIITQSMGSSNLPSKKPGNAAGPAFSGNITSISSESYGGMMKGSPLDLKPIVPKREEKKPEDPNILEKAKLASMLFGGFTDSNADSKKKAANLFTGGGLSVKAPQTSIVSHPKPVTSSPQKKKQGNDIDLLDLTDVTPPPPPPPPPAQPIQAPAPNLFSSMNMQQKKPFNKPPQLLKTSDFEMMWETLNNEHNEEFNSKIKSEADFKKLTENIGIQMVEIIGNEIICAGATQKGEIFLVYGVYNANGVLEVRLKGKNKDELKEINRVIKLFAV